MKQAGEAALDALEPLLVELRILPRLKEKKRGTFSSLEGDYERFRVRTQKGRETVLALAKRALA
jgi:hypothetical protein